MALPIPEELSQAGRLGPGASGISRPWINLSYTWEGRGPLGADSAGRQDRRPSSLLRRPAQFGAAWDEPTPRDSRSLCGRHAAGLLACPAAASRPPDWAWALVPRAPSARLAGTQNVSAGRFLYGLSVHLRGLCFCLASAPLASAVAAAVPLGLEPLLLARGGMVLGGMGPMLSKAAG